MRPGGKSNGESPFFETPNLSFEGRVGILASGYPSAFDPLFGDWFIVSVASLCLP